MSDGSWMVYEEDSQMNLLFGASLTKGRHPEAADAARAARERWAEAGHTPSGPTVVVDSETLENARFEP